MSHTAPTDDQVLRQLLAPPALDDGVESLDYWHRRGRRLPWYRFAARREAVRMTTLWERRVSAAVVSAEHHAPLDARLSAGALVARTRVGRWMRRARAAVLATMTTVLVRRDGRHSDAAHRARQRAHPPPLGEPYFFGTFACVRCG